MSAHTPGPWRVGDYGHILAPDGQPIEVEGVALPMVSTPVSKANSRLIAAAPDLLEALKRVRETRAYVGAIAREMMDAAIAKAEGRE